MGFYSKEQKRIFRINKSKIQYIKPLNDFVIIYEKILKEEGGKMNHAVRSSMTVPEFQNRFMINAMIYKSEGYEKATIDPGINPANGGASSGVWGSKPPAP
jgi:hypothetical protein